MLDYFANDKYRVLTCMARRQIAVKDNAVVKLSQQEIAEILQISKVRINAIINDLKSEGYVIQQSPRGKYLLTDKATKILSKMDGEE